MSCLVFEHPPLNFSSRVEVSSCYCQVNNELLILRRHPNKSHGNTWGVPAGKIEPGEDALTAMVREIYEEIGLVIPPAKLIFIRSLYARASTLDFMYHMFYLPLQEKPEIILGLEEHQEAKWVTFEEALQMPLMPGEQETLEYYKQFRKLYYQT